MADVPADLEGALLDLGIEPTSTTDDEVWAHCPGHMRYVGKEDHSASWSVNRVSGLANCFSCPEQSTFLNLVTRIKFPNNVFEAARWMRGFGVDLVSSADLAPFEQRGVRVEQQGEIVPETRLAMFPDPPGWALDSRKLSLEACQVYGVRWDAENDAWIIPVRYPDGELAGWQAKWARQRRFINTPKGVSKSSCLFGYGVFPVGEPAVLLESPLDVLRLYTAGFTGGLSSMGAAVSKEQMQLILNVTDELVVALDNDEAGRMHAEQIRNGKWNRGKQIERGYSSRIITRFFNYGQTKEKDIGGMEDVYIRQGLYNAQHSVLVDLANERQRKDRHVIYRDSSGLSTSRRKVHDRPRAVFADSRGWGRQNRYDGGSY